MEDQENWKESGELWPEGSCGGRRGKAPGWVVFGTGRASGASRPKDTVAAFPRRRYHRPEAGGSPPALQLSSGFCRGIRLGLSTLLSVHPINGRLSF